MTASIFISATSGDLHSARDLVAKVLISLGYTPVWQDIAATDAGDLTGVLRSWMRPCSAVIQLVGFRYGAEPRQPDPQFGRASYTQLEALYAEQLGKKVIYIFLPAEFPIDPCEAEADEKSQLQAAYRERLTKSDALRHTAANPLELENRILRFRDELAALRRSVQRSVVGIAALLLVSVGLSVWLVQRQRQTSHAVGQTLGAVQGEVTRAGQVVAQTGQTATEIKDVSKRNETLLHSVNATMETTQALSLLDRAMQTRDGSQQGQVEAIQSLLAQGHSYENTDLSGLSLKQAHLAAGDFKEAKLHFADLSKAQAQGADFSGAGLRFARLDEGNFEQAHLAKSYSPFIWGEKADFNQADLSEANFFAADFRGASFRGAKLKNTCFAFADLRGATFDGADLTGAYLIGAVLDDATFLGATVADTDFFAAAADKIKLTPEQQRGVCRHNSVMKWDIRLLEEWPSNKYSTGFEYETIIDSQYFWNFEEPSLPLRPNPSDQPAVGFYLQYPGQEQTHLARDYLSKAGRYKSAHDRVKSHLDLISHSISPDHFLKLEP